MEKKNKEIADIKNNKQAKYGIKKGKSEEEDDLFKTKPNLNNNYKAKMIQKMKDQEKAEQMEIAAKELNIKKQKEKEERDLLLKKQKEKEARDLLLKKENEKAQLEKEQKIPEIKDEKIFKALNKGKTDNSGNLDTNQDFRPIKIVYDVSFLKATLKSIGKETLMSDIKQLLMKCDMIFKRYLKVHKDVDQSIVVPKNFPYCESSNTETKFNFQK